MDDYVKRFERVVTLVLMAMMAIVVVLAVIDLAWVLARDFLSPPLAFLDIHELLDIFGVFLLVLIGIELLETVYIYIRDHEIRTEVIVLVALIALARKIITLDVKTLPSLSLVGIAAVVLSLALAYVLIRRRSRETPSHV
ncbi:MAG: phosphate-starvation-inducible PsiE family protein [Polyangiaceae bacterium]|nr:phosphate-starvation-inducible PsiE family protein [Polyangiaceae bacterium]